MDLSMIATLSLVSMSVWLVAMFVWLVAVRAEHVAQRHLAERADERAERALIQAAQQHREWMSQWEAITNILAAANTVRPIGYRPAPPPPRPASKLLDDETDPVLLRGQTLPDVPVVSAPLVAPEGERSGRGTLLSRRP